MDEFEAAVAALRDAARIFVLCGAGLSTESGIPDFRGPQGLWTKNPAAQRMFNIDDYIHDREVRVAAWQLRMASPIRTAAPNDGHRALAALTGTGRKVTIATQNIDGLQQRAGGDVLELHGTFWEAVCLGCGGVCAVEQVYARVTAGEEDPMCLECGGILRTNTVAFGQSLDQAVLSAACTAAEQCDAAIALGTSLSVEPAASLCRLAHRMGAPLVIVNAAPTPQDDRATAVLREPIGSVLPRVVAQVA